MPLKGMREEEEKREEKRGVRLAREPHCASAHELRVHRCNLSDPKSEESYLLVHMLFVVSLPAIVPLRLDKSVEITYPL
jgi:hypothetical protein